MSQWYVKDLSKLTQVSVQTLHHYDRIGLLKPSVRLPNGYRLYSEKDLLKLQQIIALKYFGFELAQIKTLLAGNVDMMDHFSVQSQFLEEKAKTLLAASNVLKNVITDCNHDKSISWENIIKSIEVYRMTQELEKGWASQVLSPEELQNYIFFEQELQSRYSAEEKKACLDEWADIVKEVNAHLDKDPTNSLGIDIGGRCWNWVNSLYGNKNVSLRIAIWEKGFKQGHGADQHGLSSTSVAWLDKAIHAYISGRIANILNKVETLPHHEVLKLWQDLLRELCGDEQSYKDQIVNTILLDSKMSEPIKNWLIKVSKNL